MTGAEEKDQTFRLDILRLVYDPKDILSTLNRARVFYAWTMGKDDK